ncbi:TraV family lipoprotein (plasmid) [Ralstonia pseudosolanacearum]
MKINTLALSAVAIVGLSGCMSMSGLDAKSEFSCKAPDGILCESMSGIYANAQANNLPGQRVNQRSKADAPVELSQAKGVMTTPIYSGTPIRSAPRLLRVWFSPWEDTDGDLHDQSYVYLPVDSGRWLIEHNRRRIQDTYRPVRAPTSTSLSQTVGAEQSRRDQLAKQGVMQGGEGEDVVIGARQDRMSNAQASELLNNVLTPSNVLPETE